MRKALPIAAYRHPPPSTRLARGLCARSINSPRVFSRKGPSAAQSFLAGCHHLHADYAIPRAWESLPWRENLLVPKRHVSEVFPEVDFTHSPQLEFPLSRDLGISTEELTILCTVVSHRQSACVVEFGTAEGRTALNLALHIPEGGKIVTLDLQPIPGKNEVGYFYWNHPAKTKINQVYCSVSKWDSRPYASSADVVLVDACDSMPGLAAELFQAFSMVKPGGVIFRHDYGSSLATTFFWNWVSERLRVVHLAGTTLLCLGMDSVEPNSKAQAMLNEPIIRQALELPGQT